MKLGVLTVVLAQMEIEKAMKYLADSGVQMVEIGCGGFPGKAHCDPEVLLNDDTKLEAFKQAIYGNGLEISALSCHGNPVHPNKEIAKKFHDDFINTILLAEKLGVDRIVGFSGCPGDCPESKYPNWVTCPWPEDFLAILDWQWNEVLIPYWKKEAEFCKALGKELRDAFRKKLINYGTMTVKGNCQGAQAIGIYYGLFDQAECSCGGSGLCRWPLE